MSAGHWLILGTLLWISGWLITDIWLITLASRQQTVSRRAQLHLSIQLAFAWPFVLGMLVFTRPKDKS